jgi:hypothetical protein
LEPLFETPAGFYKFKFSKFECEKDVGEAF